MKQLQTSFFHAKYSCFAWIRFFFKTIHVVTLKKCFRYKIFCCIHLSRNCRTLHLWIILLSEKSWVTREYWKNYSHLHEMYNELVINISLIFRTCICANPSYSFLQTVALMYQTNQSILKRENCGKQVLKIWSDMVCKHAKHFFSRCKAAFKGVLSTFT